MFRVVWSLGSSLLKGHGHTLAAPTLPAAAEFAGLLVGLTPSTSPRHVFTRSGAALRSRMMSKMQDARVATSPDLASYYHLFFAESSHAVEAARRLTTVKGIGNVEIEARPSTCYFRIDRHAPIAKLALAAPVDAETPDLTPHQGYLDAAPSGIDASAAWSVNGGTGGGITLIDIEYGWNFDHEDVREGATGVIYGPSAIDDHGTAVIGVISADPNGRGITGIAHAAVVAAASADWDGTTWNAANAIHESARLLNPGDIIILEMHSPGPETPSDWPQTDTQDGFLPIEYWDDNFAAILDASNAGIIVIAAAGNGGVCLDSALYKRRFDRQFRDSKAIMVGAGASALDEYPRSRMAFSNFGSRLDVQGWGEDVATTGGSSADHYYDLYRGGESERCYTRSFAGTSSATPIIAGVVACIQGALRAAGRDPLLPDEMRSLLAATGTPQDVNGALEHIGPLPDLNAALQHLGVMV